MLKSSLIAFWVIFHAFAVDYWLFQNQLYQKNLLGTLSLIRMSKSFDQDQNQQKLSLSWSGSKLFAKVISRWQVSASKTGLFPAILGKGPWPKLGKNDRLNIKIGKINGLEHNKGSKIYPQTQVILDCIMPSIPLKHKCFSTILIWVIVSHK